MSEARIERVAREDIEIDALVWPERPGAWRSAWRLPGGAVWHAVPREWREPGEAIEAAVQAAIVATAHPRRSARGRSRPDGPSAGKVQAGARQIDLGSALRAFFAPAEGAPSSAPALTDALFDRALKAAFPSRRARR